MYKEMKGITYCGECIYYSKKQHRCTAGAFVETDPKRTFYDDCPLPKVVPAQKWITVTERLPDRELAEYRKQRAGDSDLEVLVVIRDALESTTLYYNGEGAFYDDRMTVYPVTHWMVKPEPPKK